MRKRCTLALLLVTLVLMPFGCRCLRASDDDAGTGAGSGATGGKPMNYKIDPNRRQQLLEFKKPRPLNFNEKLQLQQGSPGGSTPEGVRPAAVFTPSSAPATAPAASAAPAPAAAPAGPQFKKQ